MKTKSIIFAAILSLQVSFLFATGTGTRLRSTIYENTNISLSNLAPVTPAEATFEDETATFENMYLSGLYPVTPPEATFEDEIAPALEFTNVAPAPPIEADFNDVDPGQALEISSLAPVTPVTAGFEELL